MNQLPYPKPIEFHVSYSPDFNGLWFWLLAPMKGPELSVLGWQGGLDRQLPELFSALGTARLLRRLGLWIGPRVHPFRGYCLLSLPAHSSSGSGNFSVTIRSPSASGSHKSCPTSSFSWHARQAASLPSVFPSLYPSALGLGWWDLAFGLLLAVKFFWPLSLSPLPWHLHLMRLHRAIPVSHLLDFALCWLQLVSKTIGEDETNHQRWGASVGNTCLGALEMEL